MPTNLELKIKIESHQKIREKLAEIDADNIGMLYQKDIYYNVREGLLKLRIENGKEILIFYRRDEKGSNRWSNFDVLKFEKNGGEQFFNRIFTIETVVQKRRELFIYDNTRIHLDEVETLGSYLELETLVLKDKEEAKMRFENIIKILELNTSEQIRKSYRDLLMKSK